MIEKTGDTEYVEELSSGGCTPKVCFFVFFVVFLVFNLFFS